MIGSTDSHVISATTAADSFFAPLEPVTANEHRIAATRIKPKSSKPMKAAREVEIAIYEHIRAMRTLGHKSLNSNDIARALSLPREIVEQALAGLSTLGVRVAK